MRIFTIVICLGVIAVSAAPASAANPSLARGRFTADLSAGGVVFYGGNEWIMSFAPGFGVFVARGLWVGGRVGIILFHEQSMIDYRTADVAWGGGETESLASLAAGADYNFDLGVAAPYVGFWGFLSASPGNGVLPRLGVKLFVVPKTAIVLGLEDAVRFPRGEYYHGPNVTNAVTFTYGFQLFF